MTIATFLATHARLSHSKDEITLGGADFYAHSLLSSIYGSGAKAMAANETASKSGHAMFCMPAGQTGFALNIEELHAFFDTIPADQRGMSIDDGMLRFIEHKFPCAATP